MRLAAFIFVSGIALAGVSASACAATLFDDGPATTDFGVFPGWQRVMKETRADIAATPIASPTPSVATIAPAPHDVYGPVKPVTKITDAKPSAGTQKPECKTASPCVTTSWQSFIAYARTLPHDKQLAAVNDWANAHRYVEDWASWGLPDYWETPAEFLARGGDCEDFAIIKYYTLARLGWSVDDMRIMIVNDTNLEIYHAVLAVRQKGTEPVLLDNQAKQLVPLSVASHYRLIYSLNEHGWWMAPSPAIVISSRSSAKPVETAAGN